MRIIILFLCGIAAAGMTSAAKLPVFLWGSTNFFQPAHDGDLRRVSYQGEDMSLLHTAVNSLLGGAAADAQHEGMQHLFKQSERPHLTVLFHGSEGSGPAIGKHPQLHATLQAAPASVSLPYVRQGDAGDLRTQLLAHAKAASADDAELYILGDCGGDTVSSGSLDGTGMNMIALAENVQSEGKPQADPWFSSVNAYRPKYDQEPRTTPELTKDRRAVVVVCPSNAEDGSAQMAALEQLSDAARRTGLTNLFLFVADPGQKSGSSSQSGGRSLLAKDGIEGAQEQAAEGVSAPAPGSPEGFVCDKKCRTQVNQLEAFILLAMLLAALGMGVCCMGILDGPTRFESQKDD